MMQRRFDDSIKPLFLSEIGEATLHGVALAVSGGSDSIALLHLTSNWAKISGIPLVVLSVNHNLRPEAVEEIDFVRKITSKLGHEFYELSWDHGGDYGAIQERARAARYDMMSQKCHELGINILLTAHHLDDMLETYLMRKNKKSGILGLSYSNSFFYNNIWVFRPLASFLKSELIDYLRAILCHPERSEGSREVRHPERKRRISGDTTDFLLPPEILHCVQDDVMWMEDKSNALDLYERNRVRMEIARLSQEKKADLITQMQAVNEEAFALNARLIATIAEAVKINNFGFAVVDLEKIIGEAQDIKIHIINYLLTIISGKQHLPRFRSTGQIISKLENNQKIDLSLHGCLLKRTKNKLLILREASQIKKAKIKLAERVYWDERFIIEYNASLKSGCYIDTLKLSEYIKTRDKFDLKNLSSIVENSHRLILFTLPVIKNLEKIVAIPHISYYDETEFEGTFKITFRPNFISRFTHFL
jgi:tRNA(Ile)-lysidine synthase